MLDPPLLLIAAPSSLSATKSHLATEFEALRRLGNWDAATGRGNPKHSKQIRDVLKGYAKHATAQGYSKRGAAPLTEAEMHMLLSSIHQQASNTTDQAQLLLLLRDGLLFSLLWQTCFRGSNAGAIRLSVADILRAARCAAYTAGLCVSRVFAAPCAYKQCRNVQISVSYIDLCSKL